jgi:hypothetical protein
VILVPQANIPKFFGVGYPVATTSRKPGTATFVSSGSSALTESAANAAEPATIGERLSDRLGGR